MPFCVTSLFLKEDVHTKGVFDSRQEEDQEKEGSYVLFRPFGEEDQVSPFVDL